MNYLVEPLHTPSHHDKVQFLRRDMFTISETDRPGSYLKSLWPQKQKVTGSIPGGFINISLSFSFFPFGVEMENNLKSNHRPIFKVGSRKRPENQARSNRISYTKDHGLWLYCSSYLFHMTHELIVVDKNLFYLTQFV